MTSIRVLIAVGDPALRSALAELLADQTVFQLLESTEDFVGARRAVARLGPNVLAIETRLLPLTGPRLRQTERDLRPTRLLLLTADEDELLRLRRHGVPVVLKERTHDLLVALRATSDAMGYATI
jgi:DNA-binding NarL/FixJ family response regulator